MPVREVLQDGRPGYRWGESGRVYFFTPGDDASREAARGRAQAQGRAALGAQAERITFSPPAAVRRAAREALRIRASLPPSRRGMTAVGLARARDLGNGRRVSLAVVLRMQAYFNRHESDRDAPGWGVDSPGWQAWLGWGGDPGRRWADEIVNRYL